LDEDGDELETRVVTDEPIPTGVWLEARIVGILNFEDDGEMDHKVVVVPADDRNTGDSVKTLADLGTRWRQQIEHHFTHYKDLKKPGSTKVLGWGDAAAASAMVGECAERFKAERV
jgi:inorganic pyrophosphatase